MEVKPRDLQGLAQSSGNAIEKEESSTSSAPDSNPKDPAPVEDIPDPEEDDLDDLDDMLDEFSPSKPETKTPSYPSGPGRPQAPAEVSITTEGISDDDFAKQLQAGMADLLGELDTSPEMQAHFESMLKELGGATVLETAPAVPSSSNSTAIKDTTDGQESSSAAVEKTFQEKIKKTMERMQASGDQATAAAASDNTDDILAEMMKAMQGSGLEGEGGEEDFSKMLLGMMEQLTNKDILYEPMKELDDKFPQWMEKNKGKGKEDDMNRYKQQQVYVREIVGKFEEKTYKDENAADREYIVERMQKMQAAGSPPSDLVGDMAAAQEAFGAPEEGCPQQ